MSSTLSRPRSELANTQANTTMVARGNAAYQHDQYDEQLRDNGDLYPANYATSGTLPIQRRLYQQASNNYRWYTTVNLSQAMFLTLTSMLRRSSTAVMGLIVVACMTSATTLLMVTIQSKPTRIDITGSSTRATTTMCLIRSHIVMAHKISHR